jgi:glycosyltransferase involved in cell wall biosynthesis
MLIGVDASRATAVLRTGTEAYSLSLIRELLSLGRGHRFRLYFNQAPQADLFPDDADVAEHRIIPFPRLWTHLRLSWEMCTRPPDILFVPSHVLPVAHPPRSVVTVHDLGYLYYPEAHTLSQNAYLRWSTRYNARCAMWVVADSEATRQDLICHYRIAPKKIIVVYPGWNESLTPVSDPVRLAAIRARYGLTSPYLLYIGTLHPRKNLVRLIQAFAILLQSLPPSPIGGLPPLPLGAQQSGSMETTQPASEAEASSFNPQPPASGMQLVLAGQKGWLYGEILAQINKLGLTDRVVLTGYVPDSDLAALLSGALAFVYPSLYEGFGFPVLEAMACGTPVVCSNRSSLPEVAGDAALLVDPFDTEALVAALYRVAANGKLRSELVERGFRQIRRFSWRRCAQEVLQLFVNMESYDID